MNKSKLTLRCICEGAIMIALAQVLGYIKLYHLPEGGSVTLAMLPMMVFCCRWGLGAGLLGCTLLGTLQLLLDGAYAWGWISIIFDYLLAYGILGIAGIFRRKKYGILYGSIIACVCRFLSHVVSGVFYVEGMTSFSLYGVETASPWLYSAIYNGAYMLPNMVILLVCGALLLRPMGKYLCGEDLK
ncbi:MAG: energy-coupled thiamine transporter ThiT [Oscillospiraceae bacterium]|nr:energy-coupled thiamine transporter ThiT [Oscillospiraceae bacterium]